LQPDRIELASTALLLDVDGTLIDIAPRPHEAHVPDDLRHSLWQLNERTGGALALVSGRPLRDVDALFAPLLLSATGGHGAELRVLAHDRVEQWTAPLLDEALRARICALADGGILVEDKGYSLAVHFRLAPEKEAFVRAALAAERDALPAGTIEMLNGKAMIEFKQPGLSKGTGVRALMNHAPFAGRRPVFIGDDVTDEDAAAVMPEFGGIAYAVGREFPGARRMFESPAEVRRWLARLANGGG
jgi:trehalose 6-phosphate phosphatase